MRALPREAGIKAQVKARSTGALVAIYVAIEQGIETAPENQYAVVCRPHGSILEVATMGMARWAMSHPHEWCDACRMGTDDKVSAAVKERGY